MHPIHTRTHLLTASSIDNHAMLRPSALLDMLQDMATEHADILGIGREVIVGQHGAFWMLVRTTLALSRPIYVDEETVTIKTWHRGAGSGAIVYRDFDIHLGDNANSPPIGEATMAWVLADLSTRKLLRPRSIAVLANSPRPEIVKQTISAKIVCPPDLTELAQRVVQYSDLDVNGHMNNVRYIDAACDALRLDEKTGKFVTGLTINYDKESFAGDLLRMVGAEKNGTHYLQGVDKDDTSRFTAKITLGEQ